MMMPPHPHARHHLHPTYRRRHSIARSCIALLCSYSIALRRGYYQQQRQRHASILVLHVALAKDTDRRSTMRKFSRRYNRWHRHEPSIASPMSSPSPLFAASKLSRLLGWRGGGDGEGGNISHSSPAIFISTSSQKSSSSSPPLSTVSNINKSNNNNPYEYIPITALNDYGRSDQLQYASMSATKFGTPILACICSSRQHSQRGGDYQHYHHHHHHQYEYDSIIVCSLQHRHRRDGVIPPTTNTIEKNGLVRQLVTRDDVDDAAADIDTDDIENDTHSLTNDIEEDIGSTTVNNSTKRIMPKHAPRTLLHTAMVVSGIRADADYLSDRLRSHAVKHWFRYDTPPSLYNMAEMVRDVMLDFLGYDRGEEVRSAQISGGIGSAAPSYSGGGGEDDDEDGNGANSRAGRPLGVSVFLLGGLERVIHGDDGGGCGGRAEITSIEADGSSRTHVARAMGVGSQFANKELSHRWKKNMCVDEAKEMMRSVMKDVAREVGWLPHRSVDDANDEEGQLTMVCEIVTSNGIEIDVSTI